MLYSLPNTLGGGDGGLSGFATLGDCSSCGAKGEVIQNRFTKCLRVIFSLVGLLKVRVMYLFLGSSVTVVLDVVVLY